MEEGTWVITLQAPPGYKEAARLDVYLTRFLPNASRAKVQQGIRAGQVLVNGRVADKVSYVVQSGDVVRCTLLRPPPTEAVPEDLPIDIVYEDDYLVVVNKAAGMVVHPAHGHQRGTLVNALLHHVGGRAVGWETAEELDDEAVGLSVVNAAPRDADDPVVRPGIVHRIDKYTSGLLVIAKDDHTHRMLGRQFERHTISRRYIALVWGAPAERMGTIRTQLGRDPRDRKRMAVLPEGAGKHAVTHYTVSEAFLYTSLLTFRLETGRTHQIRVHARHMGHPIVGDAVYDGQEIRCGPHTAARRAFYANLFKAMPRQALHAHTLGFVHPATGAEVHFSAPPPPDMQHAIDRIREVEGRPGAAQ